MTDKQKKTVQTSDDSAPKKTPATTENPVNKANNPVTQKQKKGTGVAWLALILVLAATVAGFIVYTQLQQQIDQLSGNTGSIESSTAELSQAFHSKTNSQGAEISALSQQLETNQQQTSEEIGLLQKQVGKNRRQWLVAEAEYLASLANTRLQLAGDVSTAIIALQAADQRLKENGDPMTFAVREQLAKEINALKSTELPDIVGISSRLLALETAVAQMAVNEPHAGTAQAPEIGKSDPAPTPENIQQTLNDAWENFSKLVVVRRHDKPMAALMTPEQVELIRKNLALKLEAARLALINQNEELYSASINITMQWLKDYFDASNTSVISALEQLNELKNTPIKATLPSIGLSLKMLRDIPILAIPQQATELPEPGTTAVEKTIEEAPELPQADTTAVEKTAEEATDALNKN
ncbi:MAG: hypothetical protein ACJAZI_000102 [Cycloclasticus sp.]|jgi:uroporphyrin-3 C-methyltransferase